MGSAGTYYLPVLAAAATDTITATPAELSVMDGGSSAASITLTETDQMIINDHSESFEMKQVAMTTVEAYMATYLGYTEGGPFVPAVSGISPGEDEIPTWDANGKMNRNAKFKYDSTFGQDKGLVLINGNISAGSDSDAATLTNDTNKIFNLTAPHYHNAEQDIQGMYLSGTDGTNSVRIGGGNSSFNAATGNVPHCCL